MNGMTLTIPLIRVIRAGRREDLAQARARRPELVTLDKRDLLNVTRRCQTTLSPPEVDALEEALASLPAGVGADVMLLPGARVRVEVT
jgi:hypothetical protein